VNKNYTFRDSETDWERINAMQDNEIDLSDIPEITAKQMTRATLRVGGKSIAKNKVPGRILLDANVVGLNSKLVKKTMNCLSTMC